MATEKGAFFEISTVTLPQKELRMTLFVHQVVSGAKKNQQVVVSKDARSASVPSQPTTGPCSTARAAAPTSSGMRGACMFAVA